jgi:hypothetical protein
LILFEELEGNIAEKTRERSPIWPKSPAEALVVDEDYAEARKQLEAAPAMKPEPGREKEPGEVLDHARQFLKWIERK